MLTPVEIKSCGRHAAANEGRFLLAAGLVLLFQTHAIAQPGLADESETSSKDRIQLERIAVTGTRIRQIDAESALPVTILDRSQLEATGQFRLAEALRTLPFNNLGARSQGSGVGAMISQGFVDLRGLGPNRTLLLVNGRRLTLSPQSGGEIANINNIPLSAVRRVEILRDGASAVYGSDAIGGVVNIVLEDDYQGWEFGGGVSAASKGTDESAVSAGGGGEFERLEFVWNLEHTRRDASTTLERVADASELVLGRNPTGDPGTWYASDWFGDGTGVPGPWTAATGCPPRRLRAIGVWNAVHPSTGEVAGPLPVTFCALEQSESNEWSPELLASRAHFFGRVEVDPELRLFGRLLFSRLDSTLVLTTGGDLEDAIAADNPINPGFDPETGRAPWPVSLFFGLQELGDRVRRNDSELTGATLGAEWQWSAGDLEIAVQGEIEKNAHSVDRLALRSELRQLIADGRFNPFRQDHDVDLREKLNYRQQDNAESRFLVADATWRSSLAPDFLGGRSLHYVAGAEFRRESFSFEPDPEDFALNVFGWIPGGYQADTHRSVNSAYVEVSLPLTEHLTAGWASRYDGYTRPAESELTNKLSLGWRAADSVLLRTSWGTGFRAPSLVELSAERVPSLAFAVLDRVSCNAVGGDRSFPECFPVTKLSVEVANPDLRPEESTNWNAGVVLQPLDSLSLEFDGWRVDVDDQIATPTAQQVLDLEAANALPPGSTVLRNAGGSIDEIIRGRVNFPSVNASGVDVSIHWSPAPGRAGDLRLFSLFSRLLEYDVDISPGVPSLDRVGEFGVPEWKIRNGIHWSRGSWFADVSVLGVASSGQSPLKMQRWWSVDAQFGVRSSWGADIVLGVRNLTDENPFDASLDHHDYDGRVWYARYRQYFADEH